MVKHVIKFIESIYLAEYIYLRYIINKNNNNNNKNNNESLGERKPSMGHIKRKSARYHFFED